MAWTARMQAGEAGEHEKRHQIPPAPLCQNCTMASAFAALKKRRSKSSVVGSFYVKRAGDALLARQIPDESYWEGHADIDMFMLDG